MFKAVVTVATAAALTLTTLSVVADSDQERQRVRETVADFAPGVSLESVEPSAVKGVYEVVTGSGEVVYITADGGHMFQGNLIDLESRVDLTEQRLAGINLKILETIDDATTLIYAPEKTEKTITVFTDIDCVYCRKLHQEIPALNEMGVAVRYLFFPRAGLGSDSYKKAVSVWCADDQNLALTASKSGQEIEARSCEHPIIEHMALVSRLGVTGTPAVFTPTGRKLPGYMPAKRIAMILANEE